MSISESIILGLIQGITEFFPVSSSGHLIAFREFFGISLEASILFDVILHLATAIAILIFFRVEIWKMIKNVYFYIAKKPYDRKSLLYALAIGIGIIPAVIVGFLFEDAIDLFLRTPLVVVGALLCGSSLFYFAEKFATQKETLNLKKSFLIGLFQILAFIPGFSRSGSTISGGLILGMSRKESATFSFLMGLPLLLGAGFVKFGEALSQGHIDSVLIAGFISAFISGILAIHFLMKYLENHTLGIFIWYRILLAVILMIFIF